LGSLRKACSSQSKSFATAESGFNAPFIWAHLANDELAPLFEDFFELSAVLVFYLFLWPLIPRRLDSMRRLVSLAWYAAAPL